jgi:Na+/phosphate symporter
MPKIGPDPDFFNGLLTLSSATALIAVSIVFVAISTIILTSFAEALVWAVAGLWRGASNRRGPEEEGR